MNRAFSEDGSSVLPVIKLRCHGMALKDPTPKISRDHLRDHRSPSLWEFYSLLLNTGLIQDGWSDG